MFGNAFVLARTALRRCFRIAGGSGFVRRFSNPAQGILTVTNPATEEVINVGPIDTEQTLKQKYEKARAAQPEWASRSFAERAKPINRFKDLLLEEANELAKSLTTEMGKPISQSLNEINATPARIKFFLEHTESLLKDIVMASKQNLEEHVSYEPLGVVANISAWNYPYFVGTNVIIPALLTGSTVIYKPSEHSSLTGLHIGRLLHKAGVPHDVFQVVLGRGEVGAMVVRQPIDGVFFTGSYATGQKIARAAAEQLLHVQLELGGKDPTYVCEDVDIEKAAASLADGAFYNTGQSCCSVERIYVHREIYEPFLKAFERNVRSFVVGDPLKKETYIGPLARSEQVAFLEAQVADALAKGAKLVCGGKRVDTKSTPGGKGFYFQPTVLTNVNHTMDVMMKESFGPIIGIQDVANDEEAIEKMNDNEYGLTAGVYTTDKERAVRILRKVNAGTVYWNCCDRVSPRLPWSGRRHSGIGSTLGLDGIRAFLKPKAWHLVHGL